MLNRWDEWMVGWQVRQQLGVGVTVRTIGA
jgi:hypothetical protein